MFDVKDLGKATAATSPRRAGIAVASLETADGEGVVSHAGAELLRELAGFTGLIDAWDAALIGTYKAIPIHFPGSVLADLAVAIADGADCISDLRALRDQPGLFGPVASTPTAWRVLDRVSEAHLALVRRGHVGRVAHVVAHLVLGRQGGQRPVQQLQVVGGSLDPALPGRSMAASSSVLASHHTPRG